jgi:hypothetical protein
VEEGAVGGVNNIKSQRPASKEHRIDKDALHNSKFKPTSTPVESGLIHLANQGARYLAP